MLKIKLPFMDCGLLYRYSLRQDWLYLVSISGISNVCDRLLRLFIIFDL